MGAELEHRHKRQINHRDLLDFSQERGSLGIFPSLDEANEVPATVSLLSFMALRIPAFPAER
jgi:hypothetical protein